MDGATERPGCHYRQHAKDRLNRPRSLDQVGIPGFQFIQDPRDYETRSVHTNQDVYERLSPDDLKQAAVVEAIFLYNAAMRDQMLPRKPLPHPEASDKENKGLKDMFPGAVEPPKKQ